MSSSRKPRKITVKDQIYFWRVDYFQYEGTALKIWKNKTLIYNKEMHDSKITPKLVSEIIKTIINIKEAR
jgi:hypothetical protein